MKHTPGPWKACHDGKCRCKQVWSETTDHPVAVVESGNWGDKYPTINPDSGQACMDMIVYGSIDEDVSIANIHLIAAAPDLLDNFELSLDVICSLCKRLNPQHENCTSCTDMDDFKSVISEAKGE